MKTQKNKQSIESLITKINLLKVEEQKDSNENKSSSKGKERYLLKKEKKLQRIANRQDKKGVF